MFASVNSVFVFFALLSLATMVAIKLAKLGNWKFLVGGLLLLAFSGLGITFGTNLLQVAERFMSPGNPDFQTATKLSLLLKIWSFVFNGAVFGIGVNLISSYLSSDLSPSA